MRIRSALLGVVLAATVAPAVAAGPAYASDWAPYAQAAAIVNANGTLAKAKNVTAASRASAGFYCVTLDASVDPAQSAITATPFNSVNRIGVVYPAPASRCGNDPQTLEIRSYTGSAYSDSAFTLVVS
ncbi:hypothetical protein ACIQUL_34395 [Streptomyces sp. NPDC090303]|uniref:hypothetical protein n=1 Tax=Streptomyces sp. NPDC090303 TaxID=3365960 RepID=UPI0038144969